MSKNGFGKFLAGVAVGIGIGILFAPKKGSETRQDLKNKMNDLLEKAKQLKKEDVKLAIENKVNEIKNALADLDKEKVLEIAKKKAKQIQKMTEDLVQYVVDKGSPVVEKAANALRDKAIDVTKNILEKLENQKPEVKELEIKED